MIGCVAECQLADADTLVHERLQIVWGFLLLAPSLFGQQFAILPVSNSPQNVDTLFQDRRSRLWIGKKDDLIFFDGTRFVSVRGADSPTGVSTALAEDNDGGIWDATEEGLYRFYRGKIDRVFKGFVTSVINIAPNVMLIAAGHAGKGMPDYADLYRVRMDHGTYKSERLSNWTGRFLTLDSRGRALFPCPSGWCELTSQKIVDWPDNNGEQPLMHGYNGNAQRVLRDRFDCVWFRSERDVHYQCPGDSSPKPLPADIVSVDGGAGLAETADGSIVLKGQARLAIGRPGSFHILRPANGLPEISAVIEARDGTFWFGGNKGLYRFSHPLQLEYWTEREGLEEPLSVVRVGSKTFVASDQGISVLTKDRARWLAFRHTRELGLVVHLLPGPQQTIFASTYYNGVVQLASDGSPIARTKAGRGWLGMSLAQTPDRLLWLGGPGIIRINREGNRLKMIPESVPEPMENSLDMQFESKTGKLWACYLGGLIGREAGKKDSSWRRVTTQDGLLQNSCRAIATHPNGDVWFGYNSIHAFALIHPVDSDHVSVRQFYSGGEVGDAEVHFLAVDARGWLWRGANEGVYVADPADAEAGVWLPLNYFDGLPAISANQQSFYNDPDGSVWFGVDNALVHFSPKPDFFRAASPPEIFVSAFSWNGGITQSAETLDTIESRANVTAYIGSLQFNRRNALRLRYRLLPEQASWKEEGSLDLHLGVLPWGSHSLDVQARLGTGPWSQTVSHSFVVLKPIWLSWPILLGFVGTGLATAVLAFKWRKVRLQRAKRAFPDLAEWRLATLSPEVCDLAGTVLDGRYEVGNVLARGGFATVVKGRDLRQAGQPCAIKVFRQELVEKDWMSRRFQSEVSALEKIRHPNVVSIYGHGTTPRRAPYLVMEFIEGNTLRELLETGALPAQQIASYLRQVGSALHAIHTCGICHRDLKPENLMIRSASAPGEDLVLIDFSIAIVKEPDDTIHGLSRAAGTIYYMAPEQAIGYAVAASDIYSLAKIVIEMLTGRRLSELLPDASMDLPARVRELLASLAFSLSSMSIDAISSALEFDPSRRPHGAMEFAGQVSGDLEQGARAF